MGIPSKLCLGFSACIACGTQQHLDVGRSGPALAGAVSRAKPDPTDVEHGDSGMFDRETAQQANVAGAQPADPGANGESTSPQIPGETIEDPTGRALDRFYAALRRTEGRAPSAVTRVLHMGDSSIGLDGLPHAVRRRMQERFGDGGPGFVLVDRYSKNYKHQQVEIQSGSGWDVCYIAYLCQTDGHYGLGGHSFRSKPGARARLRARREDARRWTSVEVWYAAKPHGGRLSIEAEGAPSVTIATEAEALEDRWHAIEVAAGTDTVHLRPAGGGSVRLYGIAVEASGPGIVWDSVSMIGAFTRRLHGYDDAHIARQIAHRKPDLLVLNYGGNDLRRLVGNSVTAERYKAEYTEAIRKLRAADHEMPCLVVSVIDHARSGKREVEPHHVERMVTAQREVAFAQGCGFFDSVAAMGGPGSIREWLKKSPRLAEPDLKHLNARGRDVMGEIIYSALMAGYSHYRARHAAIAQGRTR